MVENLFKLGMIDNKLKNCNISRNITQYFHLHSSFYPGMIDNKFKTSID